MKDKILTMFFDINRWTKAIEKGVLKDIRKSELIKLTEDPTGIHLLGKVMYQYYEDNYLAQICNSRNIIYIAGYISGRTEY